MPTIKLKGGALYVAIIISILVSIVLSLFIVLAYFNIRSLQNQASLTQLEYTLESGFEIAKSSYFTVSQQNQWQKMPYNNDSVSVKKLPWGAYTLIHINAKNKHHALSKTGLFGSLAPKDTALMVSEQNRAIGLAGTIKFNGMCYLPKAGVKSAYIEGTSFSDINSLRPFIKQAPNTIPEIDESYLKNIAQVQSELNNRTDSLISVLPDVLKQSFKQKTAVVQLGSITLNSQQLSNNIKIIASNIITIDNTTQLSNVLLIARKIIFKKGFKGSVHAIAKDTIITEDDCEFNYPSSFVVYNSNIPFSNNNNVSGIFFGEGCHFNGSLLAVNNNTGSIKSMIKFNKNFQLIGSAYSSNYCDVQGNIYGSVICQSLLLQTPSAVYENHLLNCLLDPKKYSTNLAVANCFITKQKKYVCAKWF